jgi:hypothetical protein
MLSSGSRALFVDDAWPFVVHSNGFCIRFGWNEKQNCWQFVGGPDAGTGRPVRGLRSDDHKLRVWNLERGNAWGCSLRLRQ